MNDARKEFAAPLGSATTGRLDFARGAYNLTVRADTSTADLYRARFEGTAPDVRVEDGTVEVDYPRTWHPLDWRRHSADVALNAAVPWAFEVRGGASRIEADLSGLRLEAFGIDGGASEVELTLPEPSGTVSVRIEGGANSLRVRRPRGVAARLHVGAGRASWRSTPSASAPSAVRRPWRARAMLAPRIGTRSPSPAAPTTCRCSMDERRMSGREGPESIAERGRCP